MFGLPGKSRPITGFPGFVKLNGTDPMQPLREPIVVRVPRVSAGVPKVNTTNEHYEEYPARRSGARIGIIVGVVAVLAIIAAFAFGLIDINQTREMKAPDVQVSGGQSPAFDVDTAKVDVGTKTTDVTVPKVEVGTTKEQIKVPTVDVEKAN